MTNKLAYWAIGLLSVALVVTALLYRHERGAHFNASLRADSAIAASDTTRKLLGRVQKTIGDSTTAWSRRVVQETQRADSLDKAMRETRQSRTDVGVTIAKGSGSASGAVHVVYVPVNAGSGAPRADSTDVRSSRFDVTAGVFQVVADVTLPAPPAVGTMAATVTAPKIPLSIREYCGSVTDGVRRADAVVTGPTWATIGIDHVESSPEMCNPTMKLTGARKYPLWVLLTSDALAAYVGFKAGQQSVKVAR